MIICDDRLKKSQNGRPLENESYQLFKTDICGFCARVQKFMGQRSINIELRDIMRDNLAHQELLEGGGKAVVPCLRITSGDRVDWLYESMDIIRYLDERFSN